MEGDEEDIPIQERSSLVRRSALVAFQHAQGRALQSCGGTSPSQEPLNRQDMEILRIERLLEELEEAASESEQIRQFFASDCEGVNVLGVWSTEIARLIKVEIERESVFLKDKPVHAELHVNYKVPKRYSLRNDTLVSFLQRLYTFEVSLKAPFEDEKERERLTENLNVMKWSSPMIHAFIEEEHGEFMAMLERAWALDDLMPKSEEQRHSNVVDDMSAFLSQSIHAFFKIRLPQCLWSVKLFELECMLPVIVRFCELTLKERRGRRASASPGVGLLPEALGPGGPGAAEHPPGHPHQVDHGAE